MTSMIAQFAGLNRSLRILEIGSWVGASALTFAQALDQFCPHRGSILCIDPWDDYFHGEDVAKGGVYGAMDEIGRLGLAYALFQHNIRFARPGVRIESRRGRSADILPLLEPASFDIVYIDGSHYFADVMADIQNADRLLINGGILCGDDLELQGSETDLDLVRQMLDQDCVEDAQGRLFHPGVTLATHMLLGEVSSYAGFWVMRKAGPAYEKIRLANSQCLMPDHLPAETKAMLRAALEPSS